MKKYIIATLCTLRIACAPDERTFSSKCFDIMSPTDFVIQCGRARLNDNDSAMSNMTEEQSMHLPIDTIAGNGVQKSHGSIVLHKIALPDEEIISAHTAIVITERFLPPAEPMKYKADDLDFLFETQKVFEEKDEWTTCTHFQDARYNKEQTHLTLTVESTCDTSIPLRILQSKLRMVKH